MSPLAHLLDGPRAWAGQNRLHDPTTGQPDDSAATLTLQPMLDGRFIRVDYTWLYRDEDQSGALLIGHNIDQQRLTGHWLDTWHMGHDVMQLVGVPTPDESIALTGSYPAPPGPDWGWRIHLDLQGNELTLTMINITPDGEEQPAVDAQFRPVAG